MGAYYVQSSDQAVGAGMAAFLYRAFGNFVADRRHPCAAQRCACDVTNPDAGIVANAATGDCSRARARSGAAGFDNNQSAGQSASSRYGDAAGSGAGETNKTVTAPCGTWSICCSNEPAGNCGRQRRSARCFTRWRCCLAAHRRQRRAHQRRGSECRSLPAARRGAGGRARADRHPAFRGGQSQPVFFARLQP